ncbi:hypothetical protein LPJ75_005327, partial [Coemansia sp. RSA 2598]
ELLQTQLDVPTDRQRIYHNKIELGNGESIGHSDRKTKHNAKRPVRLQLLVQSTVEIDVDSSPVRLLTSDICTVGQVKTAVCREMGWRASCYAVFVGAKKASEKMRMGDWLRHGGKQLRVRKLPLHRFVAWSWRCVRTRIGAGDGAAIGGCSGPAAEAGREEATWVSERSGRP